MRDTYISTPELLPTGWQINHSINDKRKQSNTFNVPSYRDDDFDTDHYIAIAKVTERFSVKTE